MLLLLLFRIIIAIITITGAGEERMPIEAVDLLCEDEDTAHEEKAGPFVIYIYIYIYTHTLTYNIN